MRKLLQMLQIFTNSGLMGVLNSNTKFICENMLKTFKNYKQDNSELSEQQLIETAINKESHFKKIGDKLYRYENSNGTYLFNPQKDLKLKEVVKEMVTVMVNVRTKGVSTEWYSKILKTCFDTIDSYFKMA